MDTLQAQIASAEAELRRRQALLLGFSVVGATLLLLANLAEHRLKAKAS